jgi:hypothetical protein
VELADIPGTSLRVSRIAIGTWAIGGWMWGGTDEVESVSTIRAALEHGINVVDTAPVYGFGRSEEIVGKAIAEGGLRSRVAIATKVGLEWRDGKVFRNASRDRIMCEIEDSLRRLRTDHIEIYQVHWPDPLVAIEETAEAMRTLYEEGKIRTIGVSNFSIAPIHVLQPPYNLFERVPIATKTRSRPSAMARFAGAYCPGGCGRIRFSTAMTCAARIPNSSSPGSVNILLPCSGSIGSRRNGSASASFTWRSAGCSTKESPRRYGARATPVSYSRSTRSSVGRLMLPSKWRSIGSYGSRSPIRSVQNSWLRRREPERIQRRRTQHKLGLDLTNVRCGLTFDGCMTGKTRCTRRHYRKVKVQCHAVASGTLSPSFYKQFDPKNRTAKNKFYPDIVLNLVLRFN